VFVDEPVLDVPEVVDPDVLLVFVDELDVSPEPDELDDEVLLVPELVEFDDDDPDDELDEDDVPDEVDEVSDVVELVVFVDV